MCIDSPLSLLDVLRRVQLLSPEQADEAARELLPHFNSAESLGEYLVEVDWLTPYQLQMLLAGQVHELVIGPFQIIDRLGEGGVSEVFKAWDTEHGRIVALKVLRQHLAGHSEMVHQLQRELQAITLLSHPNIVKTYEAQHDGSIHYFAMEYIEGMDLDRFVRQVGPLTIPEACDYVRQVAQGLQHAHHMGLVHRDVKPANLFLLNPPLPSPGTQERRAPDSIVKIIDWGLARCLRDPETPSKGTYPATDEEDIEKRTLIGTADFVAPEQARDPTLADIRADIYSLGCSLFFLLTGQPPFQGTSVMQKLLQHQESPPPSAKSLRAEVPDELDTLLRRMMAKDPRDRFAIPLLLVAPLRRFSACGATVLGGSRLLPAAPGTALNLPRPLTQSNLARPGTDANTGQPAGNGAGKSL
jgi:serine/threonine-protein kinase